MLAPDLPAFFAKDSRLLDFSFFFFFFGESQVGGRQREKLVANGDLATGNFEHCLCWCSYTTWCSKIGTLTSPDGENSGASRDVRKPISLHQAVLTWFWAVLLSTRMIWACWLLVSCIGVFSAKLHPSTSGTRLNVENPDSDLQGNCFDPRAHEVWWINSVRKNLGNIFEGWWFLNFFLAYPWLLRWRMKLKLTPGT